MKWSRRNLLKTAAVLSASPVAERWPALAQSSQDPGDTVFMQGALGGGGYACGINISPDGLTRTIRNDTHGLTVWDEKSQTWQQVMKSPNMDACSIRWGVGGNIYEVAVAPSTSARIYLIATNFKNGTVIGSHSAAMNWMTIYKSDNRGTTWSPTSMTTFQGSLGHRLSGPKMRVDPNNPDIVYAGNMTGVFFVTYNGGENWTRIDPLLGALPSARTSAGSEPGVTTLSFHSSPATEAVAAWKRTNGTVAAYDITKPLALGSCGDFDNIAAATPTSVNLYGYIEPPGVSPGDTVYFGLGSLVEIDGSSGTVPNPGIALGIPGAKGVASKTIYFGWSWGANAIWWSQDGGSSFAAMPGTTPFRPHRFKMSNDAALAGGGGNILYVTDFSPNTQLNRNAWRYVSTPPKGSGLAANTWTNLSHMLAPGITVVCPDPTKLGQCAIVLLPGNIALSKDYGNTIGGIYGNAPINATGSDKSVMDPPWLAYTQQGYHSMGDAEFDTQVSGKLWLCDGIGVWYMTPAYNSARPTWYSRTRGIDSLTIQRIVKAPKPNGRILLACQDRPFFSLTSPTVFPAKDHPYVPPKYNGHGPINHTGDILYSDSDPTVVFGSAMGIIWRSTDSGETWKEIARNGENGFIAGMGNFVLASLTPANCMVLPTHSATSWIQYGVSADGGATWKWAQSLYEDKPLLAYGNLFYTLDKKVLTSDGAGTYYYYDVITAGGTLYKSTDNGATLVKVNMAKPLAHGGGGGVGAMLVCVPGFPGHLFYAPGVNFGQIGGLIPLCRTVDGGVNWSIVPGTYYIWNVAIGKAKPGSSYPAVYIAGSLRAFPYDWGVYRSDNARADGSPQMTWTRLDHIKYVNCEGSRCMSADPDEYGTVYIGHSSSGYSVGKLRA